MSAINKPHFRSFETWGACSRCGTRFAYQSLRRERLTGLLLCTPQSWPQPRKDGCWDPWHPFLSFQLKADRSIEPPLEPLPMRTGLDNVFSAGPGIVSSPPDGANWKAVARTNYQMPVPPGIALQQFPKPKIGPDSSVAAAMVPADFRSAGFDGVFIPASNQYTPTQSPFIDLPPVPTPPTAEQLAEEYPPLNLPQDQIINKV
jgi:hypothetical protein